MSTTSSQSSIARTQPMAPASAGVMASAARTRCQGASSQTPATASVPRGCRCALRSRGSSASTPRLLAERFPHICAPPALAAPFLAERPSLLDLGGLERSRDALAGRLQELRARVAERDRARAPGARAAAPHEARAGPLQVRQSARAGSRARRLRRMGGTPAARSDRHARRLVAAQALVRLSVTQGVALHARPRFTEVSIAASV